jgi:uncharacterized membrane protein YoaK (UPF0700 family)
LSNISVKYCVNQHSTPRFVAFHFLGSLWLGGYIAGAICGSALEMHLALLALIFLVGVLALLIAIDVLRHFERQWNPFWVEVASWGGQV